MKKAMMMLGAVLAWAVGGFAATHEGVQLWENGPLWAKTNVGANSPTETGYYFWWGDTLGYKWQNNQWVASDGSKTGFSFSSGNCATYGKTVAQLQTMGAVGADGNLLPTYDAAAKQWGDDWRVPKASEFKNLMELCMWTWTTNNNVAGYAVTGKGLFSGNSIFVPVAGYGEGTAIKGTNVGYYWTSLAAQDGTGSSRVCLGSGGRTCAAISRHMGFPLRPVKSLTATKQSAAVALDTRTGTRTVAAKESIAYDAAWGDAASGTLAVNGAAVSGLSKAGTYAWTPDATNTNLWTLTYKAGTANYTAKFWAPPKFTVKFNANGGSGTMSQLVWNYGEKPTLTANAFTRQGYAFVGWTTSPNGTTIAYKDGQQMMNLSEEVNTTLNLYAKWTDTWYVNATTGADTKDGASAAQPFKTIQHAIDKAVDGMTIIVADGTYAPINTGNKPITIRSVNGAEKTIIDGGYPAATNRCVYAGGNDGQTNTVIRGFTIQNGCTIGLASLNGAGVAGGTLHNCIVRANHGGQVGGGVAHSLMFECEISGNETENGGGGAYRAYLNNCQLLFNRCKNDGAGAYGGILNDCAIVSNRAELAGGGVCNAVLTNCVVRDNVAMSNGGGASIGSLYCCIVSNNTASVSGGGLYNSIATKCVIVDNRAAKNGGGAALGKLFGCVLLDNGCAVEEEGYGGGAYAGELDNCLVYGNRVVTKGRGSGVSLAVSRNCTVYGNIGEDAMHAWLNNGFPGGTNYNCIVYGNTGTTQIDVRMASFNCYTDDPHFVNAKAGDFRLRYDSPCIDAGDNAYVTSEVDFAGNPRIVNGTVDIGAYEYDAAIDTKFSVQVTDGTGGGIYYEGDAVTVAATAKTGYTFKEWTGAAADVALLANKTAASTTFAMPGREVALTATFRANTYTIIYDANGGSGTMTATDCEYDKEQTLTINQFVRVGYRFVGWTVAEGGDSTVEDGATVKNLTSEDNGVVTLYAVWEKEKVADPVVSPANGAVFKTESCTVTITTETEGAEIYYTTNGRTPRVAEANRYKGAFTISDTATIVAVAVKGDSQSEYVEVTITKVIPEPLTLAGVLDEPKLAAVATGGDAEWLPIDDATAKVGGSCAVSGVLDDNGEEESTWLEAKVYGKGTLTFWWRVSCEPDPRGRYTYDFATFKADDEVVVQKDGESDWVQVTKTFTTDGEHVIRWIYNTDGWPSDDYDGCVWVDGVTWSGSVAPEEQPKPTIVGDEGAAVMGDAETGFVVKPSDGKVVVEVTIPQCVDAAKVTVEVSVKVTSVKPNGAKVKIVNAGADITEFLKVPAADGNGVVDLTKATVKEEIVKEVLDIKKGAKIELNAANPQLITAPTRNGLTYTLFEGRELKSLSKGDTKLGDGNPWTPEITVSGGDAAFYSIDVSK